MKLRFAMATTIACLLQAGCATSNDAAAYANTPRDEGVVLTGSRIPQRTTGSTPVGKHTKEDWEEVIRGHKQINPQGG